MLARVWSASIVGINAVKVGVEIDVSGGLPGIVVVGLPDTAVQQCAGSGGGGRIGSIRLQASIGSD